VGPPSEGRAVGHVGTCDKPSWALPTRALRLRCGLLGRMLSEPWGHVGVGWRGGYAAQAARVKGVGQGHCGLLF
jgi:hypothetical protein